MWLYLLFGAFLFAAAAKAFGRLTTPEPAEPNPPTLSPTRYQVTIPENQQANGLPQLAYRNNNPGNLRYVGQAGAVSGASGFARFPTPEAGFQALLNQIALDTSRGLTLKSYLYKFAPPKENDTHAYLSYVANRLNVAPDIPMTQVNPFRLAQAQIWIESRSTVEALA